MASKTVGCSKCGGDRFYTVAVVNGKKTLVVKCLTCGLVELPPARIVFERVAMGRIWS